MILEVELKAIQNNLDANTDRIWVTAKQLRTLAILMQKGLGSTDRELRIKVLQMIAGPSLIKAFNIQLVSSKNLTSPMASVLIDYLTEDTKTWELTDDGKLLLHLAKTRVEEIARKNKDANG